MRYLTYFGIILLLCYAAFALEVPQQCRLLQVAQYSSPEYHGLNGPVERPIAMPSIVQLNGIYPNPFNSTTRISFKLRHAAEVQLIVYDVLGNPVATLLDGPLYSGMHSVEWDGSNYQGDLSSGIYFLRLTASGESLVNKLVLAR